MSQCVTVALIAVISRSRSSNGNKRCSIGQQRELTRRVQCHYACRTIATEPVNNICLCAWGCITHHHHSGCVPRVHQEHASCLKGRICMRAGPFTGVVSIHIDVAISKSSNAVGLAVCCKQQCALGDVLDEKVQEPVLGIALSSGPVCHAHAGELSRSPNILITTTV